MQITQIIMKRNSLSHPRSLLTLPSKRQSPRVLAETPVFYLYLDQGFSASARMAFGLGGSLLRVDFRMFSSISGFCRVIPWGHRQPRPCLFPLHVSLFLLRWKHAMQVVVTLCFALIIWPEDPSLSLCKGPHSFSWLHRLVYSTEQVYLAGLSYKKSLGLSFFNAATNTIQHILTVCSMPLALDL